MRLIDADSTKEKLCFAVEPFISSVSDEIRNDTLLKAIAIVDSMATVDALPVKYGKWKKRMSTPDSVKCSLCGYASVQDSLYCGGCGALMRGDLFEI